VAVPRDNEVPHIDFCMYELEFTFEYCDMFTVGERSRTGDAVRAFMHEVCLEGLMKTKVRVTATFDDGALVNVIDTTVFETICEKLSPPQTSK
jgi:hypothetical protein